MEKWRIIVRNLGKILQEFEMNSLANGVVSAVASILAVYLSGKPVLSVGTLFSIAILLVCFYFIIHVLIKMLNIIGGKLIRFSEKWYPEWIYSPKLEYQFHAYNSKKEVDLYVKSSPKNKLAHLRLQFTEVKLINGTDEQQSQINRALLNVDNKILYDKEIRPSDTIAIKIAEVKDGSLTLVFNYSRFWVNLIPGKYIYQFNGWGTHRETKFYDLGHKMKIVLNDKGEIEI